MAAVSRDDDVSDLRFLVNGRIPALRLLHIGGGGLHTSQRGECFLEAAGVRVGGLQPRRIVLFQAVAREDWRKFWIVRRREHFFRVGVLALRSGQVLLRLGDRKWVLG